MVRISKTDVSSISPPSEGIMKANTGNVSFKTLYSGQFTLSTQLIILNYPVILSH